MIDAIKRFIDAQQFSPGVGGLIVNPFYFARRGLDRAIHRHAAGLHGELLDVGCGTKPYEGYFNATRYVGLEVEGSENSEAEFHYDGGRFPFEDESFDAVVCNQVLEHVFDADAFLAEGARVLRPEGRLLLTIPFVWDEHEQPWDFARYSSFGLEHLIRKQNLIIEQHEKINDDISVVFQLLNAYLYKITLRLPSFLRFGLTITLMAAINVVGVVARFLLPKNPDLFLDQIIVARKRATLDDGS